VSQPLVSIITPSYNQAQFIEATIESVLGQTYPNIEYIVMDGGSKDATVDILRRYDGRLTWVSERDRGQADAVNKGFARARGEIVAWLNSDDVYYPEAVAHAVKYLSEHPEVDMVYGDGDIIDAEGRVVKRFANTEPYDLWRLVHVWDYIMQPATFFRRSAWEQAGGLDIDLHWCLDWDLWIKMGLKAPIAYLPEVLACSREYEATKTSTGGWKRLREIRNVMGRYTDVKYPPGFWLYGASTVLTEAGEGSWKHRLLVPPAGFVIGRTLRTVPGRFPDGWVGPRAHFWLCPAFGGSRTVAVECMVHAFPGLLPLKVELWADGRRQAAWEVAAGGPVRFTAELPLGVAAKAPVALELRTSSSFVPSRTGGGDTRRLSLQVHSVTWAQR
jgi:GT2 family glycosyltransferase